MPYLTAIVKGDKPKFVPLIFSRFQYSLRQKVDRCRARLVYLRPDTRTIYTILCRLSRVICKITSPQPSFARTGRKVRSTAEKVIGLEAAD